MCKVTRERRLTTTIDDARIHHWQWIGLHHIASRSAKVHRLSPDRHDLFFIDSPLPHLLLEHRNSLPKHVPPLLHPLVRLDKVHGHFRTGGDDNADVDVEAGSELVEDTGGDGVSDGLEGFFSLLPRA